jgi:hypothetical protein
MTNRLATLCTATFLALAAASGPALAQSSYGIQLSPDDVGRAQSYCNSLQARANSSLTDRQGEELLEPSPDPAASWSRGASALDNSLAGFKLNRLTLRSCRELGLI